MIWIFNFSRISKPVNSRNLTIACLHWLVVVLPLVKIWIMFWSVTLMGWFECLFYSKAKTRSHTWKLKYLLILYDIFTFMISLITWHSLDVQMESYMEFCLRKEMMVKLNISWMKSIRSVIKSKKSSIFGQQEFRTLMITFMWYLAMRMVGSMC